MCYAVPLTVAVAATFAWKSNKSLKAWWLSLMFYGGALFGVVDHLWNKELFLISKDWVKDLALGVVITGVILLTWQIITALAKRSYSLNAYLAHAEER